MKIKLRTHIQEWGFIRANTVSHFKPSDSFVLVCQILMQTGPEKTYSPTLETRLKENQTSKCQAMPMIMFYFCTSSIFDNDEHEDYQFSELPATTLSVS